MGVDHEAVRNLIGQSGLALDDEDYDGFLALCTEEFRYLVTAYSAELRNEMTWLDNGRDDLKNLFEMLPRHVKPEGRFTRQVSVATIEESDDGMRVASHVAVYFTDLRGVTSVFAIGRYLDEVRSGSDRPLLHRRTVRLDTRALGPGSQIPL